MPLNTTIKALASDSPPTTGSRQVTSLWYRSRRFGAEGSCFLVIGLFRVIDSSVTCPAPFSLGNSLLLASSNRAFRMSYSSAPSTPMSFRLRSGRSPATNWLANNAWPIFSACGPSRAAWALALLNSFLRSCTNCSTASFSPCCRL